MRNCLILGMMIMLLMWMSPKVHGDIPTLDVVTCLSHMQVAADHVALSEQLILLNTHAHVWNQIQDHVPTHIWLVWEHQIGIMQSQLRNQILYVPDLQHRVKLIQQITHMAHTCVTPFINQIGTLT
jgi:hypothetical protein